MGEEELRENESGEGLRLRGSSFLDLTLLQALCHGLGATVVDMANRGKQLEGEMDHLTLERPESQSQLCSFSAAPFWGSICHLYNGLILIVT